MTYIMDVHINSFIPKAGTDKSLSLNKTAAPEDHQKHLLHKQRGSGPSRRGSLKSNQLFGEEDDGVFESGNKLGIEEEETHTLFR